MVLTVSAILVIIPGANAQELQMAIDAAAIVNAPIAADLNGPTSQVEGIKFAYKPPGATEFIITTDPSLNNEPGYPGERYVTELDGDLDITWTPTETGEYEVKWVMPSLNLHSNVVTVTVSEAVEQQSYAFLGIIPNPVGVNQEVLLHVGITQQLPRVDYGWKDLTVTVEKPDGTTATLGPYTTDATGGTGGVFIPTMVGTYKLQTNFPEQISSTGIKMLAAESDVVELVVQEDQLPYYPATPLPSEYWTRPIDSQHRGWNKIAGSWMMTPPPNMQAPYNEDAPETAHILWTKPFTSGGLVGGETGEQAFDCGDAYEGKFWPEPLIMAGKLYFSEGGAGGLEKVLYHCVDLHTGKELWAKIFLDNQTIDFGMHLYWDSFNYHGVFDYLMISSGGAWYAFDAYSGDWRFTVENVPSGREIVGPNGEVQILNIDMNNGEMSLWAITGWIKSFIGSSAGSWGNNVEGQVLDANDFGGDAWLWNVSIPTDLPGAVEQVLEDRIIGNNLGTRGWTLITWPVAMWTISLKPENRGELLFNTTWQPPMDLTLGFAGASVEDGVFALSSKETRQFWGFSLDTGVQIWGPTESQHYMDQYQITYGSWHFDHVAFWGVTQIAHSRLYSTSMSGIVYCYDVKTGERLWTYEAYDPYNEINWANNWPCRTLFITDGKIYIGHEVHSPISPKPRGASMFCLDAETGDLIFRIDGAFRQSQWGGRAIIGDSIIATQDTYDQRIYAIGKGPSEITVSAQNDVITLGRSVLFKGTVMDISPGTEEYGITKRFPGGVPCVADEDMSDWMLYVYKQFARPMASGIPVKLEVIMDPNGNWYDIGTTMTDSSGFYSIAWEPPVSGHYLLLASFAGSEAYYGSFVETAIFVDEAPSLATPIEPEEPTEAPFITTEIAILAAVAVACVIGVVAFWALKKRK